MHHLRDVCSMPKVCYGQEAFQCGKSHQGLVGAAAAGAGSNM